MRSASGHRCQREFFELAKESSCRVGDVFRSDVFSETEKMTDRRYDLHDKIAERDAEAKQTVSGIPETSCPRCGDLFYHPKTMIQDAKQHAAEWEEVAMRERAYSEKLREALQKISDHDTCDCPYCEHDANTALALPRPGAEEK